jgi:excisionase family DNA binding protein
MKKIRKKEIVIKGKRYYRVSEVCNVLGIFKNTLYNWEKKGKIPKAYRDPMSGWRLYSEKDIEKIKRISGRR